MNKYIGHETQLYGVEEHILVSGKGKGMKLLEVKNGKGLCFTVSADRCADISRLSFKGDNFSFFAPCGYVAPAFYEKPGLGFLKSFTAGFFTTCGFINAGSPCNDSGEELPLHGTIGNTPAENISYRISDNKIYITALIRDAALFSNHYLLTREYICSLEDNIIELCDTVENIGSSSAPFMMLYHCNMGYPLLSENAEVYISAVKTEPRGAHAAEDLDTCLKMLPPTKGFTEQCYYHTMSKNAVAAIFNPDIERGMAITYDSAELPAFTEWKMMGEYEYVLGLEPGNCNPDGRAEYRKKGKLKFLAPGEKAVHHLKFTVLENRKQFEEIQK